MSSPKFVKKVPSKQARAVIEGLVNQADSQILTKIVVDAIRDNTARPAYALDRNEQVMMRNYIKKALEVTKNHGTAQKEQFYQEIRNTVRSPDNFYDIVNRTKPAAEKTSEAPKKQNWFTTKVSRAAILAADSKATLGGHREQKQEESENISPNIAKP